MRFTYMPQYEWVEDKQVAAATLRQLMQLKRVAYDTETTSLDRMNTSVLFFSISDGKRRWAFPSKLLPVFRPMLQSTSITKVGWNINFDRHTTANMGIEMRGRCESPDILAWMCHEDDMDPKGLEAVALRILGIRLPTFRETFGLDLAGTDKDPERAGKALLAAPIQVVADYASKDAYVTFVLDEYFRKKAKGISGFRVGTNPDADQSMLDYYNQVYVPLSDAVWHMERRGIRIDIEHMATLEAPMEEEITGLATEFVRMAGRPINLASNPQLNELFYEDLGKKVVKKTATGGPSTDASVLERWAAHGDEYAKILLRYRSLTKLKSTYISKLPGIVDKDDLLHTNFNVTGARTGRWSSSDPNLQNIPSRGDMGYAIRQGFIAGEGRSLIVADYAQVEMRILFRFANETTMVDAIKAGKDIHSSTAELAFDKNYDDIMAAVAAGKVKKKSELTAWQTELIRARRDSKTVGFGIVYGMQAAALAEQLDCLYQEAQIKRNQFLDGIPETAAYMQGVQDRCHELGYVRTLSGRYRHLPNIWSYAWKVKSEAERESVNTEIQGSAADICNEAVVQVHQSKELRDLGYAMLLQVHDELVGDCPTENAKEAAGIIEYIMATAAGDIGIPLDAEAGIGPNWAEAKV